MYTILLKANKSLSINNNIRLYQGQALVDTLQFVIPKIFNEFDFTQYADLSENNTTKSFTAYLNVINPANEVKSYLLKTDYEDDNTTVLVYKDNFMRFAFPLEAEFTKMAGISKLQLTITWSDTELGKDYVLKSAELELKTLALDDYYAYIDNESLSAIDNKIIEVQRMISELNNINNNSDYSSSDIPPSDDNSGDNSGGDNNDENNNSSSTGEETNSSNEESNNSGEENTSSEESNSGGQDSP